MINRTQLIFTSRNKQNTFFLKYVSTKLTVALVKSRVQPGCGLVLVVDVVNFSLRCNSLFPAVGERT